MRAKMIALGAVLLASVSPAAQAAVIFNVAGNFNISGTAAGSLSGTFTTNDAITQVIGINLISSAFGSFQATTYSDVSKVDFQGLPNAFRLSITTVPTKQLQLAFTTPLTAVGGVIAGNSFENQQIQGAGNRSLIGTAAVGAVPEPASWAMMIAGFGAIGAAMRRRQRVSVSFA